MSNVKRQTSKVFVGLSGGVDSAVAALLLQEQGFSVTGVFMKNWSESRASSCSWQEDRRDALKVATTLGIPFLVFNFEKEYRRAVVDYLYREYRQGS